MWNARSAFWMQRSSCWCWHVLASRSSPLSSWHSHSLLVIANESCTNSNGLSTKCSPFSKIEWLVRCAGRFRRPCSHLMYHFDLRVACANIQPQIDLLSSRFMVLSRFCDSPQIEESWKCVRARARRQKKTWLKASKTTRDSMQRTCRLSVCIRSGRANVIRAAQPLSLHRCFVRGQPTTAIAEEQYENWIVFPLLLFVDFGLVCASRVTFCHTTDIHRRGSRIYRSKLPFYSFLLCVGLVCRVPSFVARSFAYVPHENAILSIRTPTRRMHVKRCGRFHSSGNFHVVSARATKISPIYLCGGGDDPQEYIYVVAISSVRLMVAEAKMQHF